MKHDSLTEVSELLEKRRAATEILDAAKTGLLEPVWLVHEGRRVKVLPLAVSEEYLRQSVIESAYEAIASFDKSLNALGVSTPRAHPQPETLDQWKRAAEMYLRVWLRELGGKVRNKSHLIDALALTTEEMREKAELHSVPVVPKAMHSARVTELLQHANVLEERARTAERKLREFMTGTPAERLAMAVEFAAANVVSALRSEKS